MPSLINACYALNNLNVFRERIVLLTTNTPFLTPSKADIFLASNYLMKDCPLGVKGASYSL